MSEVDHLKQDLEKEGIYNVFTRLGDQIVTLHSEFREIQGRTARDAIERNHTLVSIAYQESGEARQSALATAFRNFTSNDWLLDIEIGGNCSKLQSLHAELGVLHEITSEVCNKQNDLLCEALDQKGNLKNHLEQLQQRLKEHALHNSEVRETVWNITGGRCFYCDVELIRCVGEEQDRSRCFHVDHLVPKAHGGPDHLHNYVPACERCNISKNSKSYVEFLTWRKAQAQPPALTVIDGGAA